MTCYESTYTDYVTIIPGFEKTFFKEKKVKEVDEVIDVKKMVFESESNLLSKYFISKVSSLIVLLLCLINILSFVIYKTFLIHPILSLLIFIGSLFIFITAKIAQDDNKRSN